MRSAGCLGRHGLALILATAAVLGTQLFLSVGGLEGRYRRSLPLPEGGLTLERGQAATLSIAAVPTASRRYVLVLRIARAGQGEGLTLGPTTDAAEASAGRPVGRRLQFSIDRARFPSGALVLQNGGAAVRITGAEIRNFSPGRSRVPRFAQLFEPGRRVRYGWAATLALLAAGLGVQLGGVWWPGAAPGRAAADWRPWIVLAGPVFGLAAWLAVRAGDRFLVMGWETFLLLAGWLLAVRLLAAASRAAWAATVRAHREGRWRAAGQALLESLPPLFPAIVLFVFHPLSIYLPNQAGFDYHLPTLVPFFLAAAVWAALVPGLRRFGPRRGDLLVKALFLLGLYALMLELVTPVDVEPLDGGPVAEKLRIPPGAAAIQWALLGAFVLFFVTVRWERIRTLAQYVALTLLLTQAVTFATQISPRTDYSFGVDTRAAQAHPAPPAPSPQGNVYQIVLDAFSSQVLPGILEDPALARVFDGFVFYANNRANMLHTTESIPSFMTGTLFPPRPAGQSDVDWWRDTVGRWRGDCLTGGILEAAYERGYTVTQYVPTLEWCPHARTTHLRLGLDLQRGTKALAAFADLWLLKVAPVAWKGAVFGDGTTGLFESLIDEPGENEWGYWSVRQMAQLVSEEAGRPDHGQYVWAHFGSPHPPSVVDAQCRYAGGRWRRDWPAGYRDQATCAVRLVGTLVDELRRLGRLDRATIVVQSDHAVSSVDPLSPDNAMPAWLTERLDREAGRQGTGHWINNRSMALLLVKAPGASGPMRTDRRVVSLIDLAPTLHELKGWLAPGLAGCSLLRQDLPPTREAHIFFHFPGRSASGVKRDIHLAFDGRAWRVVLPYPAEAPPGVRPDPACPH